MSVNSNRINKEKLRKMTNTSDAVFSEQNSKLHSWWHIIKSHDPITWYFHDMIFIANFFKDKDVNKKHSAFVKQWTLDITIAKRWQRKYSYHAAVVCVLILVCPSPFLLSWHVGPKILPHIRCKTHWSVCNLTNFVTWFSPLLLLYYICASERSSMTDRW